MQGQGHEDALASRTVSTMWWIPARVVARLSGLQAYGGVGEIGDQLGELVGLIDH
jgi:hypothetical protein